MKKNNLRILILIIAMLGVSIFMFGCGSSVNPLGENLNWTYNKMSKTLTISGQGDMPEDTWGTFRELSIKHLVIEEVILPDGLEVISSEAFYGCKSLKKIEFPIGLKIIGDSAFTRSGLSGHIVFPEGLCSIGDSCFSHCDKIEGITFPESLLNIKDDAFSNCESISGELVIPDNVAYVGEEAFKNCTKVSSVIFGESLASIGPGAFTGCTGLKSASVKDVTPDYYSQNETNPSFDEQVKLIGFDESPKASELWNSYKETKLSEISKTKSNDSDGVAKMMPYYWTDSLKGETFKGTGSYADTKLCFYDDEVLLTINGRDYIKVPFEADPEEDGDEKHIKADNLLYYFGVISDLVFYDNGYQKNVIKATISLDDGKEDTAFFAVGSEETVLPYTTHCYDSYKDMRMY